MRLPVDVGELGRRRFEDRLEAYRAAGYHLAAMPLADFLKASWTGNSLAGESLKRIAQLLDERESLKSGETGS